MYKKIPKIGLRIIKSAIAIGLCFAIDYLRKGEGIVFYSQLSALWCMQVYKTNTKKNAIQRFIGTIIGAVYGLAYILIGKEINTDVLPRDFMSSLIISLMIIIVLYTTVLIKKKQASYFSCVVFLSIVVNHIGDSNPYLFVWNRFLDTIIGIIVGVTVNEFELPHKKNKDTLFISTMDDTLLNENEKMSDYSRVELNRLIDDGLNFTIATMRTPAIICKNMKDVHMKYPVIAMDGAVLYDVQKQRYIRSYVISAEKAKQLKELIEQYTMNYFANIVIDDTLLIYYNDKMDDTQNNMVETFRDSPYRNYILREIPYEDVVYFMILEKTEYAQTIYESLQQTRFAKELKITIYESTSYEGYSYIKIFNKNATMEHMMNYLLEDSGLKRKITLGTVEGKYDITINSENSNEAVRNIKKLYEIPFFSNKKLTIKK